MPSSRRRLARQDSATRKMQDRLSQQQSTLESMEAMRQQMDDMFEPEPFLYGAVGFGLGYFFGLDPAAVGIFIVVYSLLDNYFFPFLKYRAVGTLASYSLRSLVGTLLTLVAFLVSFFLTSQLKGKDCPSLLPAAGLLWITMKAVIFIKSVGEI